MNKPEFVIGFNCQEIRIGDKVAYPIYTGSMHQGTVVDIVPRSYYTFDDNWRRIDQVMNDKFNVVIEIDINYYSSFDYESQKPVYKTYKRKFESQKTKYLVKI